MRSLAPPPAARSGRSLTPVIALAGLALAGCVGKPIATERSAREQVARVGATLRPNGRPPALPALHADSSPPEFIRYAVLNHPTVAAAYLDWQAAVEAIAPARSQPDPQLTLQADVTDTLMALMPGLMFDVMAPGKRAAMGREAAAMSGVAYRTYAGTVLRVAAEARKAWINLAYVDEARRLREAALATLAQSSALAAAEYTTGRGMTGGSLEAQVRLASDTARTRSELATLGDRQAAARARFKAALGLDPALADPPWPNAPLSATPLPPAEELWRRIQQSNAGLAQMRAMIEAAIAGVEVAHRTATPDFAVGTMVDLKADPLMWRPAASTRLPIWRDKIAAAVAAATARQQAATLRAGAEQIGLAAELAQMLFMVGESDRMIAFLDATALPSLDRTIATVAAGYQAGLAGPAMIPESETMRFAMQLERVAALRDREYAVTDLLLMSADVAPAASALFIDPPPSR